MGHMKKDCWAAGGGVEGKGPKKGKGKQKVTAAKAEMKDSGKDDEVDGVWMANAENNVRLWLAEFEEEEFEHWEEAESVGECWEEDWFSDDKGLAGFNICPGEPSTRANLTSDSMPDLIPPWPDVALFPKALSESDVSRESDISEDISEQGHHLVFEVDAIAPYIDPIMELHYFQPCKFYSNFFFRNSMPDLVTISDSSSEMEVDEERNKKKKDDDLDMDWVKIEAEDDGMVMDCGSDPETRYSVAMLANIGTPPNREAELYDSGASRHMSPYRQKFINFAQISPQKVTAADGQEFEVTGIGNIHIELPNGKLTSHILLKDILYTPNTGSTLVSISKITLASYTTTAYCFGF
jgi:hypothetical protein